VARHLDELEADGWVTRERPTTAEAIRENRPTAYRMHIPAAQSQSGTSPGAGHNQTNYSQTKYQTLFAKRKAWLEWKAALKRGADPDEVILGAKRYAAARDSEDARYTKGPDGWLHADRWTDEPPTVAKAGSNGAKPGRHEPYRDPEDQSAYLADLLGNEQP
jgi:hypothetical protein